MNSMLKSTNYGCLLRHQCLIATLLISLLAGCGGKGSTKLSYSPPASPTVISFSADKDGNWTIAAGLATPMGTFSIEHTFETRDDFTYVVLRNRDKGTDQVFKIGSAGHVDLHVIGEHKLRMQREGNKWIIDTQTISGTLEVAVYPSDSAIRIGFGGYGDPTFKLTTDRMLVVEYPFFSSRSIPLDSVERITLNKMSGYEEQHLEVAWRDAIDDKPLSISLSDRPDLSANFATFRNAVASIDGRILFTTSSTSSLWWIHTLIISFCTVICISVGYLFPLAVYSKSEYATGILLVAGSVSPFLVITCFISAILSSLYYNCSSLSAYIVPTIILVVVGLIAFVVGLFMSEIMNYKPSS